MKFQMELHDFKFRRDKNRVFAFVSTHVKCDMRYIIEFQCSKLVNDKLDFN